MSMVNESPAPGRADDGIMAAYRAGVKAAADTYAKHGMQLRTGVSLPGIDATPYYQNDGVAREIKARAEKLRADMQGGEPAPQVQAPQPSDHLGSRLAAFAAATERASWLASRAEAIEVIMFGRAPASGEAAGVPGKNEIADFPIADFPLAESFGDVARSLDAALNRMNTALARISKHVE
jgi:hypothetical protein